MSGQDIIDFIIQSKLFQARHAPDGSKACLVVWSPAAGDQIDAFLARGAAMRDPGREHFRVVIEPEVEDGNAADSMCVCDAIGKALAESELLETAITGAAAEREMNVRWGVRRERWVKQPTTQQEGEA